MAQGLIVGGTNYSDQTLNDIRKDIEFWGKIAKETKVLFETNIFQLSQSGYWDNKVPFNFRIFCGTVPHVCKTIIDDFEIILNDIDKNEVTKRTIKLMRNIANVARENEQHSWRTYKEDHYWKEYGDEEFRLAEELYQEGRNFFGTLLDVGNAAKRMEDYITEKKTVVQENIDQSIHVVNEDNSINIGDGNTIKRSVVGKNNSTNKPRRESKLLWAILVPILVTVVGGVVVAILCKHWGI